MKKMNEIHVRIAEVKTGKSGDLLKAILGSCVGIAFLWKQKGVFGLAHCLLPETDEKENNLGAKFVNQAIPNLIRMMSISENEKKQIEVHIAGGGNMMSQLSRRNVDHVGALNVAAAKKYLTQYGFRITTADVGGDEGRQILLDCSDQTVKVLKLMKANHEK